MKGSTAAAIPLVLEGLTHNEQRYILARVDAKSNSEALREVGLSRSWLNNCSDVGSLNAKAETLRKSLASRTMAGLENMLSKAVEVLSEGLKSEDERIRLTAAREILDRVIGRAVPRAEIASSEPISIRVVWNEADRARQSIQQKLERVAAAEQQDAILD